MAVMAKQELSPKLKNTEKIIIERFEDELQKRLEEKAAKSKLNATHVKSIIKHVVTNEHVLALVKKAENPDEHESIPYEPKLTRAKAKELLSSVSVTAVPWPMPKSASEVQALFTDDFQEESSGDEYIPGQEIEDDPESSTISEQLLGSPTSSALLCSKKTKSSIQTNWADDEVWKIPTSKSKNDIEKEANIARRTRSKLSLSSTPLELIEESFIPPDITTDMYDMDCDNDDWMDFLKKFTRPLDEVLKPTEDEEQDPEYNILADEEIEKIDKEELRVDKAVKVSRKELNDLIAELFEYSEICTVSNLAEIEKKSKDKDVNDSEYNQLDLSKSTNAIDIPMEQVISKDSAKVISETVNVKEESNVTIKQSQIPLLEQQMRQHIQILAQNFILTYQHPELHHYSARSKEYLLNLKFLSEGRHNSTFSVLNLLEAIALVEYWEKLLATNSDAVKNMKRHIEHTIAEGNQKKATGTLHIPTFPDLILETISNSEVFLYPQLLPKIPFKPCNIFPKYTYFTDPEDQLIAMGVDQFEPIAKKEQNSLSKSGKVKLIIICSYIKEYMMPFKDLHKIYNHICFSRHSRCADNPIKYYFTHKKLPPVIHCIQPLYELQVLPPSKRLPDQLPHQWKIFNYPHLNITSTNVSSESTVNVQPPVLFNVKSAFLLAPQYQAVSDLNVNIIKSVFPLKRILPKKSVSSFNPKRRRRCAVFKEKACGNGITIRRTKIDPLSKFVEHLSQPSALTRLTSLYCNDTEFVSSGNDNNFKGNDIISSINSTMLPNMPILGTPTKKYPHSENSCSNINKTADLKDEVGRTLLPEVTISSNTFQQADTSTEVEFCKPVDYYQTVNTTCKIVSKQVFENLPSISSAEEVQAVNTSQDERCNTEVIQRSMTKLPIRKEPSGAEKKRAKLRKEFVANLSISAPESPELEKQKSEMFALAYYDKMRETLELEDYHKIMQILNDHEGDAIDLYRKVEKVLFPKYQELAEEFLLFLREKEAAAVNRLVPWITMNNRSKFLRKLEIYFNDQPAQLRKIYKCLTELSQTVNISMEKIKSTLLPMFKGNTVLNELFLQNFLHERPPTVLLEGPYEIMDVAKELSAPDNEGLEAFVVPDTVDKYGGPSCICSCHQIEDSEFKSRYRHCIRCGTRETEDEIDGKKKSKRTSKKKTANTILNNSKEIQKKIFSKKTNCNDNNRSLFDKAYPITKGYKASNKKTSIKALKDENVTMKLEIKEKNTAEPGAMISQQKQLIDEPMEWDDTPDMSSAELKMSSPDQQTADSESEFCEESSQDNCESDSDSSTSTVNNLLQADTIIGEESLWRREEDKIILETFQKENDKKHAFKIIADKLKSRSVAEISNRFQTLMTLLLETLGKS